MIVLSVIIVFVISILLNFLFVKKLENKTNRICMRVLNVVLSLVFIILFISVEIINRHLNSFIDLGIVQLEKKVDEIYPGALQKQMNTEEIKNLLEKNEVNGVQALADNIIKTKIENYALVTLKTINVLERDNNKLSVKDALLSIKELSVNSVSPYFKVVKVILFVLYLILALLSVLLTFYLSKDKDLKNDRIVFGEEADKTFIGMKTE